MREIISIGHCTMPSLHKREIQTPDADHPSFFLPRSSEPSFDFCTGQQKQVSIALQSILRQRKNQHVKTTIKKGREK